MQQLYTFDLDTVADLMAELAKRVQRRRLEKALSREALSAMSGVPAPTIAKFEQKHTISLASFVAIAKALGYTDEVKKLLDQPKFNTMDELEEIRKNKNRVRGKYEFDR